MKIKIAKPLGYTFIGRKDNQEDSVYPPFDSVTANQRCFVLCDGVGGSDKGEVASRTVAETMGRFLSDILDKGGIVTTDTLQKAVFAAYDALDPLDDSQDQRRMATTMTCVCFDSEGVTVGHTGDSRIYQVRPGSGIIYQSCDHSLVNALLQAGEITEEEAINFPRKNVITRAMQPNAERRLKAEAYKFTDIKAGDYFFMCSDGVLEQVTNDELKNILDKDISDEEKIELLKAESVDKTRDNYTAYLIHVTEVEGAPTKQTEATIDVAIEEPTKVNVAAPAVAPKQAAAAPAPKKKSNNHLIIYGACCVIAVLVALIIILLCGNKDEDKKDKSDGNQGGNKKENTTTPPATKAPVLGTDTIIPEDTGEKEEIIEVVTGEDGNPVISAEGLEIINDVLTAEPNNVDVLKRECPKEIAQKIYVGNQKLKKELETAKKAVEAKKLPFTIEDAFKVAIKFHYPDFAKGAKIDPKKANEVALKLENGEVLTPEMCKSMFVKE